MARGYVYVVGEDFGFDRDTYLNPWCTRLPRGTDLSWKTTVSRASRLACLSVFTGRSLRRRQILRLKKYAFVFVFTVELWLSCIIFYSDSVKDAPLSLVPRACQTDPEGQTLPEDRDHLCRRRLPLVQVRPDEYNYDVFRFVKNPMKFVSLQRLEQISRHSCRNTSHFSLRHRQLLFHLTWTQKCNYVTQYFPNLTWRSIVIANSRQKFNDIVFRTSADQVVML